MCRSNAYKKHVEYLLAREKMSFSGRWRHHPLSKCHHKEKPSLMSQSHKLCKEEVFVNMNHRRETVVIGIYRYFIGRIMYYQCTSKVHFVRNHIKTPSSLPGPNKMKINLSPPQVSLPPSFCFSLCLRSFLFRFRLSCSLLRRLLSLLLDDRQTS